MAYTKGLKEILIPNGESEPQPKTTAIN